MNNAGYNNNNNNQQQQQQLYNGNAWMKKNPKQLLQQIQGVNSQDDDLKNILLNMASESDNGAKMLVLVSELMETKKLNRMFEKRVKGM